MNTSPDEGRNNRYKTLVLRVLIYCLGLFSLSFGIVLSVNANLGVSSGSAFPYVMSLVTGISLGRIVIFIYGAYILIQWILLGKKFKLKSLLQVVASTVFGYFVDFSTFLLGDFALPGYPGRLVQLAVSMCFVALGIALFVSADIIYMPIEGLADAIGQRFGLSFFTGKTIVDCASVGLGLICSFVFLHTLTGIREGTIISALLMGTFVQFFSKRVKPLVSRILGTKPTP